MAKITIDGKEVRAEICSNLAVVKKSGWKVRHKTNGDWLGVDRVFDSKEHAMRFAWEIQERLNFNCQDTKSFAKANPGLTRDELNGICDEEFEKAKL